jgi:hypothetical protein
MHAWSENTGPSLRLLAARCSNWPRFPRAFCSRAGLNARLPTCLGLVDPPGKDVSLCDCLFGLVVRLVAEQTATPELVGGYDAQ